MRKGERGILYLVGYLHFYERTCQRQGERGNGGETWCFVHRDQKKKGTPNVGTTYTGLDVIY